MLEVMFKRYEDFLNVFTIQVKDPLPLGFKLK